MLKKRANVPGETAFFEGGRLSDGNGMLREPNSLATLSYEVLFCVLSESGVWEMGQFSDRSVHFRRRRTRIWGDIANATVLWNRMLVRFERARR